MNITQLLFWVQDNTLSEKFYKKLGFHLEQSDDDHSRVVLNGFAIELVSMRNDERFARDSMTGNKGLGMYVYIHVPNIDVTYRQLVATGLRPTEPKNWPWGNREFVIKDPDGYKLCFWQRSK